MGRQFIFVVREMPTFRAKFTDAEKKAFGRQLRKLMGDKGLSGADLARQMSVHLPSGKTVGRDNISWYLNGRSMPTQPNLIAMAKVLEIDPDFLMPRDPATRPGEMPPPAATPENDIRMRMSGDGMMHLQLNTHLPRELGWKILEMIEQHRKEPSAPAKSR